MRIIEKIKAKQNNLTANAPVTIAFLGDSVTQGCFECYLTSPSSLETVFDAKSSYSEKLKEMLNLLYPSVQFNIINSGISGDSAVAGLQRIERDVLAFHPDLVVVGYALNDSCFGESGLASYRNSLCEIVGRIKASGAECILLTPNMMCVNVSCHLPDGLFVNLAKNFGEIQLNGMLDKYVVAEKSVAEEYGVPVCDVYSKWKNMWSSGVNTTELLANKLNHPIRELHNMTAYMLCECIFEK